MFKKTAAFLMSLCMAICCFTFPASAADGLPDFSISKSEWDAGWSTFGNINTNACLTPGSDETQMNFAWHAAEGSGVPAVTISGSRLTAEPAVFTGSTAPADEGFVTCRVTVTGLLPETVYNYTYGTGDTVYGPFMFRSLKTEHFKFLYVNDMHAGYDAKDTAVARDKAFKIHAVLSEALTLNPDISFIIAGGDQTDSGQTPAEWNALLSSPVFRSLPAAFAIGNHDKKGITQKYYINNPNEYPAMLPSPVGKDNWFRCGDVLFLLFDSTNGNAIDHINFAKEAVNKNLDAKWRIGVLHNDINSPAFGFVDPDNNLIRIIYTTIIDRAGLDLLLNGHSHIYGRSRFLKGGKIVDWAFGKQSTDPQGTVYISMSALNNVASSLLPWQNIWTAKRCRDDITTYSTFEVSEGCLKYKAYYAGGKLADEYTICKTKDISPPFIEPKGFNLYTVVKLGGLLYTVIDKLANPAN